MLAKKIRTLVATSTFEHFVGGFGDKARCLKAPGFTVWTCRFCVLVR
jgi:hypothetical protein